MSTSRALQLAWLYGLLASVYARAPEQLLSIVADGPQVNGRPIIGILSLPGGEVGRDLSYISAGYVKWLEAAGARVAPIMYDLSDKELKRMFGMINGLLIPGGNYPLKSTTQWYHAANLLYDLAVKANRKGDYFPIHGTCLGLQLLVTLVCHDPHATSSVDAHDHPSRLIFTDAAANSTFMASIPQNIQDNLQHYDIAMHNHFYGLLPEALSDYPELGEFYEVLAWTTDRQGVRYASILEGRHQPFTAVAFHPEKVPYEWTTSVHLPHSRMAIDAAYFLAQALVDRARLSLHRGANIMEEDRHLIYNWNPRFSGKHEKPEDQGFFEQIYVFVKGENYPRYGL